MDIQKFIDLQSENWRLKAGSDYNLGDFIQDLEKEDQEAEIKYEDSYENYLPTVFGSWRGSYSCLALFYEQDAEKKPKVKDILKLAKEALGKEFYGWKGGEFLMDKSTPIYCCAEPGYSSHEKRIIRVSINTSWKICGLSRKDEKVLIKTKICDVYGDPERMLEEFEELTTPLTNLSLGD